MPRGGEDKTAKLKAQFGKMDKNGDGCLDYNELKELLLSGNKGMSDKEVRTLYNAVDTNGDGIVKFDEFIDYIYGAASPADDRSSAGRNARLKGAGAPDDFGDAGKWSTLEPIFEAFVGKDCDGREFNKMMKDTNMYDRKFKNTDCDLIFAKVVPKGCRRMDYEMWQKAIAAVAGKKGMGCEAVQDMLIASGGPKFAGTKSDAVRFHDDKSTYTGAHTANDQHGAAGGGERDGDARQARLAADSKAVDAGNDSLWGELEGIFEAFVGKDCDGREFSKLCKDTNLYDRKYTSTDADLVFSHVVPRGKRRMDYEMFKGALGQIAKKKGCGTSAVQDAIIAVGGPKFAGTKADAVRFHDDKSSYTGAHTANEQHGGAGAGERDSAARQERLAGASAADDHGDEGLWGQLSGVFESFVGKDCDGREFAKLCKDTNLYDKKFTATDADLVFSKVVPRGQRRMDYTMFQDAVAQIAKKKGTTTAMVQEQIMAAGGPSFQGTQADSVRFHDDKSTYTGAHHDK